MFYSFSHFVYIHVCYVDAEVKLEKTEYEVDENEGHVEIYAVITTPCSECLPLNGFITLSVTPDSATSKLL